MMTKNIVAMQNMKNTATMGTESLDVGIVSATSSMNTVTANIRVTATDNLEWKAINGLKAGMYVFTEDQNITDPHIFFKGI